MADTGIITSQYVRIDLPIASVADRILAQIVDWLVLLAYSVAILWLIVDRSVDGFWPLFLLWFAPLMFYTLFCEFFFHGQTLGKMVLKTRVVMSDGERPSLGAYVMRWILWIADGPTFSFLGLLVMVLNHNNQRLGDMAAGTVIIKQVGYKNIQMSLDDYDYLSQGYTPRYPQAADLSLEQIEIIRRTLSLNTKDQQQRIEQLATIVGHKLSITRQEDSSSSFLQRIIHDYQYYAYEEI